MANRPTTPDEASGHSSECGGECGLGPDSGSPNPTARLPRWPGVKKLNEARISPVEEETDGVGSETRTTDVAPPELTLLEQELAREHTNLQAIFDAAQVGMLLIDGNGEITRANHAATQLVDTETEKILGHPLGDGLACVHARAMPQGCGHSRICPACPIRRALLHVLQTGNEVRDVEMSRTLVTSGVEKNLHFTLSASPLEIDGQRQALLAISDITERKQMEQEVRRSHRLLNDVLKSASEISIIATDPDGLIVVFNRGAERMLGYSSDEMIHQQTPAAFHLDSEVAARGHELTEEFGRTIEGFRVFVAKPEKEGSELREWTYVSKDGAHIQVALVVTAMRSPTGEITGYLGIAQDITERKRAEAALRQSKLELEQSVQELQAFNRTMTGRETRIIEIKQEVNQLSAELGRDAVYADGLAAAEIPPPSAAQPVAAQPVAAPRGSEPAETSGVQHTASTDYPLVDNAALERRELEIAYIPSVSTYCPEDSAAAPVMSLEDRLQRLLKWTARFSVDKDPGKPPDLGNDSIGQLAQIVRDILTNAHFAQRALKEQVERQEQRMAERTAELERGRRAALSLMEDANRTQERLREMSERDPLTGMLNRRAFRERLALEWERASRYRHSLSCVMLDLDFFKRINDTHGHVAGDATLIAIADLLEDQRRSSDALCRYGGEEFCLLLPETSEADATEWAERVRLTIAQALIPAGELMLQVTASFGVAERKSHTAGPEDFVQLADEALAVAKQTGRNRVVGFAALQESTEETWSTIPWDNAVACDVMSAIAFCPHQRDSAWHVADLFLQTGVHSAPVVDDSGTMAGVVTEADLMTRMAFGRCWDDAMREVMRTDVVCYEEQTPLKEVYQFLSRGSILPVVVVDQGRPTGVISRATLLRWFRQRRSECGANATLLHREEAPEEHEGCQDETVKPLPLASTQMPLILAREDQGFVLGLEGEATGSSESGP